MKVYRKYICWVFSALMRSGVENVMSLLNKPKIHVHVYKDKVMK